MNGRLYRIFGFGLVLALAAFMNKPFYIDDPVFQYAAQKIPFQIWKDTRFSVDYLGHHLGMIDLHESTHPPGFTLLIKMLQIVPAPASRPWLPQHLLFLVFPLAFIFFIRRFWIDQPELLTAMLLGSPLFFVNATNLMADVPALCLAVGALLIWFKYLNEGGIYFGLSSASLFLVSIFLSFQNLYLGGLFFYSALVSRKSVKLAWVGLAIAAYLLYWIWVYRVKGLVPVIQSQSDINMATFLKTGMHWSTIGRKCLYVLAFLGFGSLFILPLSPITKRPFHFLISAILSAFSCSFLNQPPYQNFALVALKVLVALGFFCIFIFAKRGVQLAKNENFVLFSTLMIWLFGVLFYCVLILPVGTARYLLPAFVPLSMVLLYGTKNSFKRGITCLTCSSLMSLLMAQVDYSQAWSQWALADRVAIQVLAGKTYFSDDGPLGYLLQAKDAQYLATNDPAPPIDAFVVYSRGLIGDEILNQMDRISVLQQPAFWGLSLFNTGSHAGFYSSNDGLLPIGLTAINAQVMVGQMSALRVLSLNAYILSGSDGTLVETELPLIDDNGQIKTLLKGQSGIEIQKPGQKLKLVVDRSLPQAGSVRIWGQTNSRWLPLVDRYLSGTNDRSEKFVLPEFDFLRVEWVTASECALILSISSLEEDN